MNPGTPCYTEGHTPTELPGVVNRMSTRAQFRSNPRQRRFLSGCSLMFVASAAAAWPVAAERAAQPVAVPVPGEMWPMVPASELQICTVEGCEHIYCLCDESGNVVVGQDYTESSDVECPSETFTWYHRNADGLVDAAAQMFVSFVCPSEDYLHVDWYTTPFPWGTSWDERGEWTRYAWRDQRGTACFCADDGTCIGCTVTGAPAEQEGSGQP